MNLSRRLLCLLLCFSLLSCVFSVSVSAETVDIKPYKIYQVSILQGPSGQYLGEATFLPNNNLTEYNGELVSRITNYGYHTFDTFFQVSYVGNGVIIPKGRQASIKLNDAYHSYFYKIDNGSGDYVRIPTRVRVLVVYADGNMEYINECTYNQTPYDPTIDIEFSFTPKGDVVKLEYNITVADYYLNTPASITCYAGEANGDSSFSIFIEQQSEEAGLLGGVINWIKSIFESIGNIVKTIGELPSKIWELISNGLKSLFVPSEEYINEFKGNMDSMLSNKLGAIYQVVDITLNSWDRIQANDESNTIDFPKVSIPLPEYNTFEFGGQQVQIVPEGFEFLATSVKTIVGISCTALFVNGLKKRYDEVMGGKE